MKIELNLSKDSDIRTSVKELVKGQVKNIVRKELSSICTEVIQDIKISSFVVNSALAKAAKETISRHENYLFNLIEATATKSLQKKLNELSAKHEEYLLKHSTTILTEIQRIKYDVAKLPVTVTIGTKPEE